jgi:hypothetical protein
MYAFLTTGSKYLSGETVFLVSPLLREKSNRPLVANTTVEEKTTTTTNILVIKPLFIITSHLLPTPYYFTISGECEDIMKRINSHLR